MSDDKEQVNVRVSPSQKARWDSYVENEENTINTISDLVRTSVEKYVNTSADTGSVDETAEVVAELERMSSTLERIEGAIDEAHADQLGEDDVKSTVDETVRHLLYNVLVGNEEVQGVSLKDE